MELGKIITHRCYNSRAAKCLQGLDIAVEWRLEREMRARERQEYKTKEVRGKERMEEISLLEVGKYRRDLAGES